MTSQNNMVWFAEDDRNDVFLIERALRRYTPNLKARFASSLEQLKAMIIVALERNMLPAVIVTDLKLTGESGYHQANGQQSSGTARVNPETALLPSQSTALRSDNHKSNCPWGPQ